MNNKGQVDVVIFLFMLGTVIIILGIALAPAVKEFVDDARDADSMDCDNTSDKYTKMGCVVSDLTIFYFVMGIILLGGAVLAARKFT